MYVVSRSEPVFSRAPARWWVIRFLDCPAGSVLTGAHGVQRGDLLYQFDDWPAGILFIGKSFQKRYEFIRKGLEESEKTVHNSNSRSIMTKMTQTVDF